MFWGIKHKKSHQIRGQGIKTDDVIFFVLIPSASEFDIQCNFFFLKIGSIDKSQRILGQKYLTSIRTLSDSRNQGILQQKIIRLVFL